MSTKAAKALVAGDSIVVNGKTVTVDRVARTHGAAGDVAVTFNGTWEFRARPNAEIPLG